MKIISRHEAAATANFHVRTLDRLHVQGLGPPRVQLTRRRCGYDDEVFAEWLRSRAFSSMAASRAARVPVDSAATVAQREPQQTQPRAVASRSSTLLAVPQPVPRAARLRSPAEQKRHNRSNM
jgi:hypothetical protein